MAQRQKHMQERPKPGQQGRSVPKIRPWTGSQKKCEGANGKTAGSCGMSKNRHQKMALDDQSCGTPPSLQIPYLRPSTGSRASEMASGHILETVSKCASGRVVDCIAPPCRAHAAAADGAVAPGQPPPAASHREHPEVIEVPTKRTS